MKRLTPQRVLAILHQVKRAEAHLPPVVFRAMLWGAAATLSAWKVAKNQSLAGDYQKLPPSLRPQISAARWRWQIWLSQANGYAMRLPMTWPDRLTEPRWQARIQFNHLERLERSVKERPVILAVFHFGPFGFSSWLKARGFDVAILAKTHSTFFREYVRYLVKHRLDPALVTRTFALGESKQICEFLTPGKILVAAVDVEHGRQIAVQGEDFSFSMATGAIRLAARTNAVVIPCVLTADRPLHFTMTIGEPVPDAWIQDKDQHALACSHIFEQFLPAFRSHPAEGHNVLFGQFHFGTSQAEPAPGATNSGESDTRHGPIERRSWV